MSHSSHEVSLASRPQTEPTLENFELKKVEVNDPAEGEILVRNRWMSVDPYMRGRMRDVKSYVPPFQVGDTLDGAAIGEVLASGDERFSVGDVVLHQLGWRELALVPADHAIAVDASRAPEQAFLGILGMPGLTAYAGLIDVLELREGDVLFVSGAAGAVGSAAGQMGRKLGASRVIGSAGGEEKVRHLIDDLGFDAAIDYKRGNIVEQLSEAAPDGINAYFDNVGGEHLEAAIGALRLNGRIAISGAISQYNAAKLPPGPRNLIRLVPTRGTIRGFLVIDHEEMRHRLVSDVTRWLADGSIKYRETIVDGLENAPQAFIDLFSGGNTGKMLVRLN